MVSGIYALSTVEVELDAAAVLDSSAERGSTAAVDSRADVLSTAEVGIELDTAAVLVSSAELDSTA